jgi:hypothetical protein
MQADSHETRNALRRFGRLPEWPSEHFAVYAMFDFRSDPRTKAVVWGNLTDGPATHDDAYDAVAEYVEKERAPGHAWLSVVVLRTRGNVTEDVTASFLEVIAPDQMAAE